VVTKILKYLGITIVSLIIVIPSSALLYREYLKHKVAEKRAITSSDGINSLEAVRIGGIDQWIEVRGQNVNNPILLWIHGGPGIAFIPLSGSFQDPWEKYFTVVQWDQRGAGKTYEANDKELQRRTMNVPQMQQDTLDVVNYLRNRFKRQKIFIVGHSWGSVLGLWLAHEHPDAIYAYVGVGQVVDTQQNDRIAYLDALQQARTLQNVQAIRDLESIAPSSPNMVPTDASTARYWEAELLGPPSRGGFTDPRRLLTDVVSAPEYSLADDIGFIHGMSFSLGIFVPQLAKVDLKQLGPDFRTPIFFFEGKDDPYCRPALISEYFQTIRAPEKAFIWFDHSGHFPFYEEPPIFTDQLIKRVLPLAAYRPDND
jgi:proline iminopeptidase